MGTDGAATNPEEVQALVRATMSRILPECLGYKEVEEGLWSCGDYCMSFGDPGRPSEAFLRHRRRLGPWLNPEVAIAGETTWEPEEDIYEELFSTLLGQGAGEASGGDSDEEWDDSLYSEPEVGEDDWIVLRVAPEYITANIHPLGLLNLYEETMRAAGFGDDIIQRAAWEGLLLDHNTRRDAMRQLIFVHGITKGQLMGLNQPSDESTQG